MSTPAALVALAAAALGTYLARASLILLLAGRALPLAVERALANVGPAVLAALTVNLAVGGGGLRDVEAAEVAALVVAAVVARWRANLLLTVAAGMTTLWVVLALT